MVMNLSMKIYIAITEKTAKINIIQPPWRAMSHNDILISVASVTASATGTCNKKLVKFIY